MIRARARHAIPATLVVLATALGVVADGLLAWLPLAALVCAWVIWLAADHLVGGVVGASQTPAQPSETRRHDGATVLLDRGA